MASCPTCQGPLITANGQELCGRCDVAKPEHRNLPAVNLSKAIEAKTTELARSTAMEAFALTDELLALTRRHLNEGMIRDPSKVAREIVTVAGIALDKQLLLEGRPTQITEHRDLEDYAKILQQLAPNAVRVIDSTAEEA